MRLSALACAIVPAALLLSPVGASADFRSGLSAYNGGDYRLAFSDWITLAEQGDAAAETGIGFLFHKGLGVAQDDAVAASWFTKAAEQEQPEAQLLLGTMFFFGHGVPRNYVAAFAWCEIAQTNGQADAGECRDAALEHMTADEMKRSFRLVRDWQQRHEPFAR